jgi:hypothetical protein
MADLATTRPDGNGPVSGRSSEHPDRPSVFIHDFPVGALPVLATELRTYGATVTFHTEHSGEVQNADGRMTFEHSGTMLIVRVVEKPAYFITALMIGGIRQTCQEAAERWRKQNAGN